MADKMPQETSPAGKPSIKHIGQLKAMGTLHVRAGHGTEWAQVTAAQTTSAKAGAHADSKGTFWHKETYGPEYKMCRGVEKGS